MQKSIVDLLFENRGNFISGKQLAEIMNISTVAVWKRIQRLIREGYEIEALRKKSRNQMACKEYSFQKQHKLNYGSGKTGA